MKFMQNIKLTLPELPYSLDALAPYISAQTVDIHYNKHHQTYLNNLNNLLQNHTLNGKKLDDIIMLSYDNSNDVAIFNNAAQVWNHTFYWNSMKKGSGTPVGKLQDKIKSDFGNYEAFKEEFTKVALSQFGSGWAWLVFDPSTEKLKITKTGNANLPMISGQQALITIDVWEHAYYIDYQNRRIEYLKNLLDNLINWEFANQNFLAI